MSLRNKFSLKLKESWISSRLQFTALELLPQTKNNKVWLYLPIWKNSNKETTYREHCFPTYWRSGSEGQWTLRDRKQKWVLQWLQLIGTRSPQSLVNTLSWRNKTETMWRSKWLECTGQRTRGWGSAQRGELQKFLEGHS